MRDVYGPNRKDLKKPLILHFFDQWHVCKSKLILASTTGIGIKSIFIIIAIIFGYFAGLKKVLSKIADMDVTGKIKQWCKAIINHVYWIASSTPLDDPIIYSDTLEAKWISMGDHIANKHRHANPLYSTCAHPRRKKGDRKRDYLKTSKGYFQKAESIS